MKKNKNCLNCAFCTRNKNKLISFGIMSNKEPFWSYHCESLSVEEREMLKQNNDRFIGEDKRAYDNWIAEYNRKKADYQNKVHQSTAELKNNLSKWGLDSIAEVADIVSMVSTGQNALSIMENPYGDYKKYGIEEQCPSDYNDEDYLSCWKQCWNESKNQCLIQQRAKLKQYRCSYFYDFNNKADKTLELCNEELKEQIEHNRFMWTISLTAITLIIAFITLIATIYVK